MDPEQRNKKEILCSYDPEEIYNLHPNTVKEKEKNYRLVCEIHGICYTSVCEAAKSTKEKEEKIRTKLYNNYPGYVIVEKVIHG